MKKLTFIYFLTFTWTNLHCQTNVYFPFPDSNAVWCDSVGLKQVHTSYCGVLNYYLDGDTIVSGVTHHKLYKKEQSYQIHWTMYWCLKNYPNPFYTGYAGAIRQDINQRKVYFLSPSSTTESLLYDFTLNVGDTMQTNFQVCPAPITITTIDSILIGNNYRKRWIINDTGCVTNGEIIEGIGSTLGLLDLMVQQGSGAESGGEPAGKLYCFSQNNQALYPNYSPISGCDQTLGITNQSKSENIFISPNPTSDQFFIDANTTDKLTVDLYDVNGRHVFSKSVSDKSNINVTTLNEGFYSLTIKTADRVINKKLVIVH